jgi:hypothetical protein
MDQAGPLWGDGVSWNMRFMNEAADQLTLRHNRMAAGFSSRNSTACCRTVAGRHAEQENRPPWV